MKEETLQNLFKKHGIEQWTVEEDPVLHRVMVYTPCEEEPKELIEDLKRLVGGYWGVTWATMVLP